MEAARKMKADPSDAPTIRHIKTGGYLLRTAVWENNSDNVPLLLFNGIGANLELVAPFAEAMGDRDIIAFDVPGVGGSGPANLPYRPWQLARMVSRILDELGYPEVDVMGVSWGGAMAQQFAFQYASRTRKLILAATSAGVVMVPGAPAALMKLAHPRRYMDPDYLLHHFESLYGDERESGGGHASRLKAPTMRGYMYQLLAAAGWTSVPFLPFMKVPTLILAGDNDQIVPVINARFLNKLIRNSRLEVVHGGHLFLVSRTDIVVPMIRDFLAEA